MIPLEKRLSEDTLIFLDIKFKVDDGTVAAHKPLLMARCEMMYAMFNDNFIEASADMVSYVDFIVGCFCY